LGGFRRVSKGPEEGSQAKKNHIDPTDDGVRIAFTLERKEEKEWGRWGAVQSGS